MGKKLNAKILTLALVCTMVLAGAAMPAMADELLQSPDFNLNENQELLGWGVPSYFAHASEGGRTDGTYCIKTVGTNSSSGLTQLISGIESGSVVELTAWFNMVSGGDIRMHGYAQKWDEAQKKYVTVYNSNIQITGKEGNIGKWVQYGLSVFLPDGATAVRVTFFNRSTTQGSLIDDVSVKSVEDGNLFLNSEFKNKSELGDETALFWSGGTVENESLKITAGKTASFPTIYIYPGVIYKLSFRYKSDGGTPRVYQGSSPTAYAFNFQGEPNTFQSDEDPNNDWMSYTAYITNRVYRSGVPQEAVYLSSLNADGYFDDVSLTSVREDLTLDVFKTQPSDLTAGLETDPISYISYAAGEALSTLPASSENVYLLANVWNDSLELNASEKKTVLVGIYNIDDGKKQLCNIGMQEISLKKIEGADNTGAATGEVVVPGTAIIPLTMPEESGQYEIKAFVWDSVSGLTPFYDDAITVLSGNNTQDTE